MLWTNELTVYTLICTTFVSFSSSKSPAACNSNFLLSLAGTEILNLSVISEDWHFTINLAPVIVVPNDTVLIRASVLVLSSMIWSGLFLPLGQIFVTEELLTTMSTKVVEFCGISPLSDAKTCKLTRSGWKNIQRYNYYYKWFTAMFELCFYLIDTWCMPFIQQTLSLTASERFWFTIIIPVLVMMLK